MSNAAIATIGHNRPPEAIDEEPTPFDLSRQEIDALYEEATHWLDGEPIESQEVANKVAKLMADIRAAAKTADERRKAENEPFDKGKAEVQSWYNPLIQKERGKADLALSTCKKALAPFLQKQEDEKRRVEAAARAEAERLRQEAEEKVRAASGADLAKKAEAEAALSLAKSADKVANRAAKDRAGAFGGARAASLRTRYRAEITDMREFARFVWVNHLPELEEFLQRIAQQRVDGKSRDIPGVTVVEQKVAV
ncbi:hypothetical protein [Aurantimonas coralicida]|uniref:hypothetical protein n=1 Tax=Aurantimonas coralicida TaxID=182270 RepID=UPI001E2B65CC|nr:hypothetical protein [Aurantimonas coralicida]MCD1645214.1 hypothetical protein [Aurantimonas coralicida]